ncbi:MAG: OFA family MFS transporter [Desulfobacteraceae bacterium]|nr:OFA family MFS transporter [Desulfobacteraceae bacterium]
MNKPNNSNTHITISFSRGWLVTAATMGLGILGGVLYVWSVFKVGIPDTWGWSNAEKALPYSVMAIIFSLVMIPAGQLQDRYGPRPMVMVGGFLAGLGCIIAGLGGNTVWTYILGFGIVTGTGVGFAYAALTPAAIKWFPREKTGFIAGLVVAGNGFAPMILAPLAAFLLNFYSVTNSAGEVEKGVALSMVTVGGLIWLVSACLSWFVYNPPPGFVPISIVPVQTWKEEQKILLGDMLKELQFWLFFVMFFSGASAGLVFISVAADLGAKALGEWTFFTVVVLSLGNTMGRIIAGIVSDKVGRQVTLMGQFLFQASMIGLLYLITSHKDGSTVLILVSVFLIGMNYGSNLTIFPAACKDYFGLVNFGLNYGCLFAAFGLAGLIMPWLNGLIIDITGKADLSYLLIVCMLVLSAGLAFISQRLGPPVNKSQKGK